MSGITLERERMELVKQERQAAVNSEKTNQNTNLSGSSISITTEFHFVLVPKYVVVDVREDSPAALAGIEKDDKVLSVNGKACYQYELYELIELFSSEEGKRISMEIERGGLLFRIKFNLKNVF